MGEPLNSNFALRNSDLSEERFVFAFVAGFVGLDFEEGAGLFGVDFRPLAVASFYLGAINDGGVDGEFAGLFYFAAVRGRLNGGLNGGYCRGKCSTSANAAPLI